ncbi:MutS-related protein [Confluentibacter sediminis]|uniref:MutS-related protein n=1 Tax=Confluentibacter sediminis TaxID=2219045 RepID=UPI000DABDC33|nr:DNA mismatch repair protein [Confluentibacter sediminis]
MAFKVDNQTISDLKIIGNNKGNDIYGLFNKTNTRGGAEILKDMFKYPSSKEEEIMHRVNIIQFFKEEKIEFPFNNAIFDTIEFYLSNTDERTRLTHHQDNVKRRFESIIGSDTAYQQINKGVLDTLHFLVDLSHFVLVIENKALKNNVLKDVNKVKEILDSSELTFIKHINSVGKLSYDKTVAYDQLFRFTIKENILKLLHYAYEIDVFITVAKVSEKLNFAFAEINKNDRNVIEMQGVFHPLVPNAVSNDITIDENNNMIFLTGANMAGKSTFMKTFSIAVYLAHMGFPVPADSMRFNIQNGMFTTINLADDLNMGFSHFYAEVSRVKKVAEAVNTNDRLIVVFDELFRGTNVKDAYEATVAVVSAFATKRKCTFIISTHIVEAGEDLKKLRDNIKFLYLPTIMKDKTPQYTYTIKEGITEDRHGMIIIQNEKILDILKN